VPRTPKRGFKVCVCGASGYLGQPLCMLAVLDPLVWELSVYDRAHSLLPPEGVGCDLGHLERKCKVKAYALSATQKEIDHLEECLTGCHLVIACAGVPVQGKSKAELVKFNGNMIKGIVEASARFCPDAVVGLIVNPINAIVPAMATLYEKAGLNPQKICGITCLDVVRANKFVHEETSAPIEHVRVPVVGGHAGHFTSQSACPLFSQDASAATIQEPRRSELIRRIQDGNREVAEAKKSKGTATISQAYAGWRFGHAVISGLAGEPADEYCFLKSDAWPEVPYFASKVTFGYKGVQKVHPFGNVTKEEQSRLDDAKKLLQDDINVGLQYAGSTELFRGADEAAAASS